MSARTLQPELFDRLLAGYARRRWPGFNRLRRLLHPGAIEVRTDDGVLFTLQPDDYIDRVVLREGSYEPEVFAALQSAFAPGAVLWDIGANFGLHSITAAHLTPGLQVHSFEPNPAMFSRLEAHARRNSAAVRCWPLALGDHDGTAVLHIHAGGNPGMTTLTPWAEARYDAQVSVPLARADTLINRGDLPAPTVVKLDVEGAEAAVLAGFGDWLRDPGLRAVVFEAPADLLAAPAACPAARALQAAGFSFRALHHRAGSDHALENFVAERR